MPTGGRCIGLLAGGRCCCWPPGRRRRSCGPASRSTPGKTDRAGADALVKSELDRHPTHRAAERGLPGDSHRRADRPRGAGRQVGHRAHQHPGPVPREGRRRRDRPGGPAPADGGAEQRSADPAGPRIEHLAAAPGAGARAPQRDALRRRAVRAGRRRSARPSTRCRASAFTAAARGERAGVGVRLGGAFNPGSDAPTAAPARAVRRPGRGRLLRLARPNHVAVRERAGRARLPPLRGAGDPRRSGRDRARATSTGLSFGAARRRRDAAHRRRPPPGVPAARRCPRSSATIPTTASSTSGCPAPHSAPASCTDRARGLWA